MREIIEVDQDGQKKCGMCNFRHSTLYRFEDEEHPVCASCFLQIMLEEDTKVADDDELLVNSVISEQVSHALAELSTGELDQLENTLRAIEGNVEKNTANT